MTYVRLACGTRSLPGHVVATDPGDVILMDEHVLHAAFGGSRAGGIHPSPTSEPGGYSLRSAVIGSTCSARIAGSAQATSEISTSTTGTTANVTTSCVSV